MTSSFNYIGNIFAKLPIIGLFFSLSLHAALEFPQTSIVCPAQPTDTEMVAIFPFTNIGDTPEEIVKLNSSCGCTVPELTKRVYQPGESGEIKAVFTFGERVGKQIKTIGVVTASTPDKPVTLRMETTIPEWLSVSQRMVMYSGAGQESSKTITIKIDERLALQELTAEPSDTSFQATLGTHPVSKQRTLTITRPDPAHSVFSPSPSTPASSEEKASGGISPNTPATPTVVAPSSRARPALADLPPHMRASSANTAANRKSVLLTAKFANGLTKSTRIWVVVRTGPNAGATSAPKLQTERHAP